MPIGVVLAEDSYIVRKGLIALIEGEPELQLLAACEDADTLLRSVDAVLPDVVLTDIRMPPTGTDEGIRAARTLRERHPGIGVVVLSQHLEADYVVSFFEDGTRGRAYLLKEHVYDPTQLLSAVRTVHAGGSLIDPTVTEALVQERLRTARSPLARLTDRERDVLDAMAQGKDNAAIATSLYLSVRAVERHTNAIFSKLGLTEEKDVHRRVKAVLVYLSDRH